tara:strand:- start:234 stop:734 length:501 start_codon:yes stop_codon:yes gene_type:complete
MKSGEIITYLGYAALIIIVIYFVTGILKISGEGLQNVLVGPLIEGMSANEKLQKRQKYMDKMEKNYEQTNKNWDKVVGDFKETLKEQMDNDEIEGFEKTKNNIKNLINYMVEYEFNNLVELCGNKKNINTAIDKDGEKKIDKILKYNNFLKFLEEYEPVDASIFDD